VSNAYLVEESDIRGESRVPVGHSFVVGRTDDCDFVLTDAAASRRHMEIRFIDGEYKWRDLDSTNGVFVNDKRCPNGTLRPGDRIRIGATTLVFEVGSARSIAPKLNKDSTLIQKKLIEKLEKSQSGMGPPESDVLLDAVHAVMNEIASNYEPCSLVDRILQTTMRAIGGQRGAVFFARRGTRLGPCPVCQRVHLIKDGELVHTNRSEVQISQTIAERVLNEGESVLVRDVASDETFDASSSAAALSLKSIICVPLRGKYGVLGILYVDTDRAGASYTQAHMLMSTAVGNSAGLALENAQMHQEILQKQLMDQDIEVAAQIQEGFLVRDWPGAESAVEIYAEMRPARTVGGDFYDFVPLSGGRVGVLIGDVSGKGVPASLTMAQVLAEFRTHALRTEQPLEVLRALNRGQCRRSKRGIFCTLLYLVYDPATGSAIAANAGHHPVLRLCADGVSEVAEPTGPPVGVLESADWEETEFPVHPGDLLLLYTDGIIEARGAETSGHTHRTPTEYGVQALMQFVGTLRGKSAETVVQKVLDNVMTYCEPGSPHDDCTLLALRIRA